MDYMEFKNQMLAEIEERLTEKEYACYEPADGNMLEESLVIQEVNEPIRFGATVTSMYRAYKSGYSIRQIAEEIIREKDGHKEIKGLEKIRMLEDYERVKEDLYIRIISTKRKVTVMERGIYRKIGDIILGVYLRINEDDGKLYTTLIDNTYLDKWELSKEDVLEQAMDNTVKMAPPRFYDGMQLKWQMDNDEQVYVGDSALNLKGLVTLDGVPVNNSAKTWATSTPDEIRASINQVLSDAWAASA